MPRYKKKKHNKIFSAPSKAKGKAVKSKTRENLREDIPMTNKSNPRIKSDMRVVRGKAIAKREKFKILSIVTAVIIAAVIILNLIAPAGIISYTANTLALIGSGGYPIDLENGDTLNTLSMGSYYFILTGTKLSAYANSGKELFTYPHGFDSPILKASKSRAVLFNQGEASALIFDLKGLKKEINCKKNIITACVSDSGAYAIATHSDKYSAAVTVYSKTGKKLYEWFSAEESVNNIALSSNGKKLAVSSFVSSGGKFSSTVRVLSFKSADALFSKQYDNALIYNIDTTHPSYFGVITPNKIDFIGWSRYKQNSYENDYNITFFRGGKGGFIALFNRENDKNDNRIALFSSNGKLKYELKYNGIISDIRVSNGHIYCMNDNEVTLLNKDGKILRKAPCSFGSVNLAVLGSNTVAVIGDSKIEKILLEQEK